MFIFRYMKLDKFNVRDLILYSLLWYYLRKHFSTKITPYKGMMKRLNK